MQQKGKNTYARSCARALTHQTGFFEPFWYGTLCFNIKAATILGNNDAQSNVMWNNKQRTGIAFHKERT